jgi:hypothetical protein
MLTQVRLQKIFDNVRLLFDLPTRVATLLTLKDRDYDPFGIFRTAFVTATCRTQPRVEQP